MSTDIQFEGDTLTLTRVYDAPREEVFDAWVAVNKVEKWWGCRQTTKVQSQIEPRVGGHRTLKGPAEIPLPDGAQVGRDLGGQTLFPQRQHPARACRGGQMKISVY